MSEHDPLCPEGAERDEWPWPCMCDLIAKVRADERERIATAIEAWPAVMVTGLPWLPQARAALIARNGGSD